MFFFNHEATAQLTLVHRREESDLLVGLDRAGLRKQSKFRFCKPKAAASLRPFALFLLVVFSCTASAHIVNSS